MEGRKAALRRAGRCYICNNKGHRASDCTENRKCCKCGGKHHVYICELTKSVSSSTTGSTPPKDAATENAPAKDAKALLITTVPETKPEEPTLFMTGQLIVEGSSGEKRCRILIDSCSKLTYITQRLSESIGAKFLSKEKLKISAFAGVKTEKKSKRVAVEIGGCHDPKPWYNLKEYEVEHICDPLPPLTTADWMRQMQAESLTLADEPEALKPSNWCGEIDPIIGAGEAVRILTGKTRLEDSILAFEMIFGWVVWGEVGGSFDNSSSSSMLSLLLSNTR